MCLCSYETNSTPAIRLNRKAGVYLWACKIYVWELKFEIWRVIGLWQSQSPTPMRVELHYKFRTSYTSLSLWINEMYGICVTRLSTEWITTHDHEIKMVKVESTGMWTTISVEQKCIAHLTMDLQRQGRSF